MPTADGACYPSLRSVMLTVQLHGLQPVKHLTSLALVACRPSPGAEAKAGKRRGRSVQGIGGWTAGDLTDEGLTASDGSARADRDTGTASTSPMPEHRPGVAAATQGQVSSQHQLCFLAPSILGASQQLSRSRVESRMQVWGSACWPDQGSCSKRVTLSKPDEHSCGVGAA